MSTKRRVENLEAIVSQLALKMFGPCLYLNLPVSERLDDLRVDLDLLQRQVDIMEDTIAELSTEKVEKLDKHENCCHT